MTLLPLVSAFAALIIVALLISGIVIAVSTFIDYIYTSKHSVTIRRAYRYIAHK